MIISLMRGQLDFQTAVAYILAILVIVYLILPFHEWAHAFTALKLGDTSIKYRGRLTLNPLAHIDPFGALAMLLFGIGWAKPVPIDSRNFKKPKLYMGITALMGPVANIVAAIVGGFIFYGIAKFTTGFYPIIHNNELISVNTFGTYVYLFLSFYVQVNISLAVFNLLPISPLDGSKILFIFLPDRTVRKFYQYEQYISIGLIALLWLGSMNIPIISYVWWPINFLSDRLLDFVSWLTKLPFGL